MTEENIPTLTDEHGNPVKLTFSDSHENHDNCNHANRIKMYVKHKDGSCNNIILWNGSQIIIEALEEQESL